jgi:hypothetical protein
MFLNMARNALGGLKGAASIVSWVAAAAGAVALYQYAPWPAAKAVPAPIMSADELASINTSRKRALDKAKPQ